MGPEGRSQGGAVGFVAQVTIVQPLEFTNTPGTNTGALVLSPLEVAGCPIHPRQGTEAEVG